MLGQLNSQVESLKRQARAARRYKEISAEIRRQEALVFHLSWTDAQELVETEEAGLREALAALGEATEMADTRACRGGEPRRGACSPCARRRRSAPPCSAVCVSSSETFETEARRSTDRVRELEARTQQLGNDIEREDALIAEAREILASLDTELTALDAAEAGAGAAEQAVRERRAAVETEVRAAEAQLAALTAKVAERRAKLQSLEASRAERVQRL